MSAGIMGRRRRVPNRRSRRLSGQVRPQERPTAIGIVSATASASTLTVVFDQAVILRGVPRYTTSVAGATAVSAERISPTEVNINFSTPIAAASSLTVPYEDPAIRNTNGGFVLPYTALALS